MKKTLLCLIAVFGLVFSSASLSANPVLFEHPWSGARVAFLGDSITDPRVLPDDMKYWQYLQEWLQITPLVYGRNGHQWHQVEGRLRIFWSSMARTLTPS